MLNILSLLNSSYNLLNVVDLLIFAKVACSFLT